MKEYIKKLIICVVLSCDINYANGDVFELRQDAGIFGEINVTVDNATEFQRFINVNRQSLPMESINPFVGEASNATQMLGYAVFFPEGSSSSQQIYVAKKRAYVDENTPITDYSNIISIDDFRNSTNFDHTERQLLSRILTDYNISAETVGTLCIYTYAPPCRKEGNDNLGLCCIDYYKKILQNYSQIKLKIYFADKRNIVDGGFKVDSNFCEALANTIQEQALFDIKLKLGNRLVQIGSVDDNPIEISKITFERYNWKWHKRQLSDTNSLLSENATQAFNNLYNCEQNPRLQFNAI